MPKTVLAALVTLLASGALFPAPAPAWAPAGSATIRPGTQTVAAGAQCPAIFVFTNASGTYIGQAAHCSGTGAPKATNGCSSPSLPLGTPVEVRGASRPGTLV